MLVRHSDVSVCYVVWLNLVCLARWEFVGLRRLTLGVFGRSISVPTAAILSLQSRVLVSKVREDRSETPG